MVKNYIRIALRNLSKRKSFTAINILGLAIGVACCLLIALYVSYEASYDEFHSNANRIYRVTQTTTTSSKVEKGATTPFPVASALKSDFPASIIETVRLFDMQTDIRTIRNKEKKRAFRVDHFYYTDTTFFDVFSVNMVRGNPDEALSKPMSIVISEKYARLFFGDENPVGKTLNFKGIKDFTVTGVMESLPPTSHMKIGMLASFSSMGEMFGSTAFMEGWFWNPCWTFVLLEDGASAEILESKFAGFVKKNYTDRPGGEEVSIGLQPITKIHLYSHLDSEMEANSSIFYIYLLSIVAVLILLIACINFMNLSTARSTERAREVGMRKVLGAQRRQLIGQFMGESFLMSFLGIAAAILLAWLALPWFNDFVGRQLSFSFFGLEIIVLGLFGLLVVIGLLSGVYPALYLSGFNPSRIIQESSSKGSGRQFFRKGLVVVQFALSAMLIIGTVIVYLQLQHMQNKKLGFDKERVVVMPVAQTLITWEWENFKTRALESPNILEVSGIDKILGSEKQFFMKFAPVNTPDAPPTNMTLEVTYDFLDTYNIDLLAGRGFSREHSTDSEQAILINRAMLKQLGADSPQDALGNIFNFTKSDDTQDEYKVIGVVEDFNYTSIKKEIEPLVIRMVEGVRPIVRTINWAAVKLAPNNIGDGLADLKKAWEEVNYIDPFTYTFQDEELQKIYASETKMSRIAGVFSVLCIFVACLGLFGLASFTSSLRTKEIGIRKTLGASVPNIVKLLSKDYLKLVIVANIIGWPVIYYLAVQWLQNFPYRIELGWNLLLIFPSVCLITLLICMGTVSYQSIHAAMVNPIDSIQRE